MHGRLKVKDSAEKAAEKAREREKKRKKYLAVINALFEKRAKAEHDAESLQVCALALQANPDALTIWNCRRETLLHLKGSKYSEKKEENDSQTTQDEEKDTNASAETAPTSFVVTEDSPLPRPSLPTTWGQLMRGELDVVAACLERNHKSYGAWHHRTWVVKTLCEDGTQEERKELWASELKLCDMFLKLDERNFHCWDYRRFITQSSNTPNEKELRYSLQLINANFSNFSAWHYRSKLLPLVHPPDCGDIHPVSSKVFDKELRRIVEAIFTDPSDQSPWFFLRWLLQRPKSVPNLLACGVGQVTPSQGVIVCSYSAVISTQNLPNIAVTSTKSGETVPLETSWSNVFGHASSKVWMTFFPWKEDWESIKVSPKDLDSFELDISKIHATGDSVSKLVSSGSLLAKLSEVTLSTLKELLNNCTELNEIDPDKKWVLFSLVELLWTRGSEDDRTKAQDILDQLCSIDPLRTGYYLDTKGKMCVEHKVKEYMEKYDSSDGLEIKGVGLQRLSYTEYLSCTGHLDLSSNKISKMSSLAHCTLCSHLVLDGNPVYDISTLSELPLLKELSLKDCGLQTYCLLLPLLQCKSLQKLSLLNNLFSDEMKQVIQETFKHLSLEI